MTLGERLQTLREEQGLDQLEVAEAIGSISNTDLSRYEKDKRAPHHKNLVLLAKYFSVTVDYLVGMSDQRQPDPAAGLPEDARKIALEFIDFLQHKYNDD